MPLEMYGQPPEPLKDTQASTAACQAAACLPLLPAAGTNYYGARLSSEFRDCPEGRGNSRP